MIKMDNHFIEFIFKSFIISMYYPGSLECIGLLIDSNAKGVYII